MARNTIKAAVSILCNDKRSGYATKDTEGRANIRASYQMAIVEFFGTADEVSQSPEFLANWYAKQFWTA